MLRAAALGPGGQRPLDARGLAAQLRHLLLVSQSHDRQVRVAGCRKRREGGRGGTWIFSHTLGTPKKIVGRTSRRVVVSEPYRVGHKKETGLIRVG
jgi:hypothetical protein